MQPENPKAVANAALATRLPGALVTEAGVSSIFAGGEDLEDRPLLVSDDLGLANLARGFGVKAVNTQAVLQELRRVGELTDQEYSSLIAQLALLNYRFLQVETADILRLLEASGFLTDERTRAFGGSERAARPLSGTEPRLTSPGIRPDIPEGLRAPQPHIQSRHRPGALPLLDSQEDVRPCRL